MFSCRVTNSTYFTFAWFPKTEMKNRFASFAAAGVPNMDRLDPGIT
jgi:hypothetical protein